MLIFSIGKLVCFTQLTTVYKKNQKYEAVGSGFIFRQTKNWLILMKWAHAFLFYFNLSPLFLTRTEGISQPPLLY